MAHAGGRPPIYDTPEQLQAEIDEYIDTHPSGLSISGLAYHCGFESRQSFYDYEKKEKFSYTIKRARFLIEQFYENKLLTVSVSGAIFALKNLGWSDKHELDHTSKGESITGIRILDVDGTNL